MVFQLFLAGFEGGKNARKSFCPIAGAEGAAIGSEALNNNFVWITDHGVLTLDVVSKGDHFHIDEGHFKRNKGDI